MRYSGESRDLCICVCEEQAFVEFRVIDHGKGIEQEDLQRVQGKFVRGRGANSPGSGLGLAIVQRIVKDHGGCFRLDSEVEVGTTAILTVPAIGL